MAIRSFETVDAQIQSFKKTLDNFLSKCPLDCSVTYNGADAVVCYEDISFNVNMLNPKKAEIEALKLQLLKYYPTLQIEEFSAPDVDVLQKMIEEGKLTLKDALTYKERKVNTIGTIIRLHNKYNEIDVKSHNKLLKYKVSVPLTLFMQNVKKTNFIVTGENTTKLKFVKELKSNNS